LGKRRAFAQWLESKVDCIVENGNFAAHLAQRIFQQYFNIKPVEPKDITPNFLTPIQIGIDEETAKQMILDAEKIILQVIHKKWLE